MRDSRPLVYLAGPYSKPDPVENMHRAIKFADRLLDVCVPVIPHLTGTWHMVSPKPYDVWLALDLVVMSRCDAVYRFGGESDGADGEVLEAERLGIPVVFSEEELRYWISEREAQPEGELQDALDRFSACLQGPLGDGQSKRRKGTKPPWYEDDEHEAAIYSHLARWKRGELHDPDSGCHPLEHAAVRCLMIACTERGDVPEAPQARADGIDEGGVVLDLRRASATVTTPDAA